MLRHSVPHSMALNMVLAAFRSCAFRRALLRSVQWSCPARTLRCGLPRGRGGQGLQPVRRCCAGQAHRGWCSREWSCTPRSVPCAASLPTVRDTRFSVGFALRGIPDSSAPALPLHLRQGSAATPAGLFRFHTASARPPGTTASGRIVPDCMVCSFAVCPPKIVEYAAGESDTLSPTRTDGICPDVTKRRNAVFVTAVCGSVRRIKAAASSIGSHLPQADIASLFSCSIACKIRTFFS